MQELVALPISDIDAIRCVLGFTIDLNTVDREGETFAPGAFDLTNHQKIPLALFSHDRNIPIGITENRVDHKYDVQYDAKTNICTGSIWFNQSDWEAMKCFDLAYHRIARGISPGFITHQKSNRVIERAEIVEFSLCLLPENPDALVDWVQKSLRDPIEVNAKIVQAMRRYLPAEKVTMLIGKSLKVKEEEKPAGDTTPEPAPPVVQTKEMKKEEEEDTRAPGSKALDLAHSIALANAVECEKMCKGLEPDSRAHKKMKALIDHYKELAEDIRDEHAKAYPDDEELKAEEGAAHELPVEEVKHLKELEREFKTLHKEFETQNKELESLKRNRRRVSA